MQRELLLRSLPVTSGELLILLSINSLCGSESAVAITQKELFAHCHLLDQTGKRKIKSLRQKRIISTSPVRDDDGSIARLTYAINWDAIETILIIKKEMTNVTQA